MSTSFSPEEKFDLITRNLQEVLGAEQIKTILADEARTLKCYWGTAPTGRPHVGYLVPLAKIADFLLAGVHVKVLLADLHAFLDAQKAPLELVGHRVEYYRRLLIAIFTSLSIPIDKLEFVVGTSYQLKADYTMDVYRLSSLSSDHDAKRAGAEVVKQSTTAPLSCLLYPGLQALDEQYLDVDVQFGGADQRKIFIYAEEFLPKLGYAKRSHLMNRIVPGLQKGGKMSSSDPKSKIDFLDGPAEVKKKVKSAFCEEGNVEENGILAFFKAVAVPISELKLRVTKASPFVEEGAPEGTVISIRRDEKWGGNLHFSSYDDMESRFADKSLHPSDLKSGMTDVVNALLAPFQEIYKNDQEFRDVEAQAYPVEKAPEKKVKVKKDRGTGKPPGDSDPKAAKAAPTGPVDKTSDELVAATESIKLATE